MLLGNSMIEPLKISSTLTKILVATFKAFKISGPHFVSENQPTVIYLVCRYAANKNDWLITLFIKGGLLNYPNLLIIRKRRILLKSPASLK